MSGGMDLKNIQNATADEERIRSCAILSSYVRSIFGKIVIDKLHTFDAKCLKTFAFTACIQNYWQM